MFYTIWNILILLVGCFVCTCAGSVVFRRAAGGDFLKKNFDRVETLCVEFLAGSGLLGTVWLALAILPGGWLGRTLVLIISIAVVAVGGRAAWRDVKLAWTHVKIIVTHPYRESDISVKILHWLILAGLAATLLASFLPPENSRSVSEFLVARQAALNNGLTAAPGVEPFSGGGLLAEINVAALMLFSGTRAAGVVGFIYLLAGMMLASGVCRRAGLNYLERWLLVLVLTAWGVVVLGREGTYDEFASCGLAIAAFIIISVAPRADRGTHVLAGLLIAWAMMFQCVQAAVLLPATIAFALSTFAGQKKISGDVLEDDSSSSPTLLMRMGWLFAPLGVMFVLWLLKNLKVYGWLMPKYTGNPFTADALLSAATLPLVLVLVIYLKLVSGKKLRIGGLSCEKPLAFMWQLLAFIIVLVGIVELFPAGQDDSQKADFIRIGKTADPEKDRVFTLSQYRYFLDDKMIASSSGIEVMRELSGSSDAAKWQKLWDMGYRYVYLTPGNTAFDDSGGNFIMTVPLGGGKTFTLDSSRMPAELGLDMISLHKSAEKGFTHGAFKIGIRENAIILEELTPGTNSPVPAE